MVNPGATYKVLAIRKGGRVTTRAFKGKPSESAMFAWAKEHGCSFVSRYYPSRKGWRLIDLREAQNFNVPGQKYSIWKGFVRGDRYYPTEDGAIMHAIAILGGG